jgi:IclR family KDG regulon transcriptional repressor
MTEDITNKSVVNALQILNCFSETRPELGPGEVEQLTGIKASTAYRMLVSMQEGSFIARGTAEGKYRLGLGVVELAKVVLNSFVIRGEAAALLHDLSQRSGGNANVAILDGTEVFYLGRYPSPQVPDKYFHAGRRVPAYCTGLGKAMLAFSPNSVVEWVLAQPLKSITRHTIVDPDRLRAELESVRENGFAWDVEEWMPGTYCIAAPVLGPDGQVEGAVSLTNTGTRLTREHIAERIPDLIEVVTKISYQMGYSLYNPWNSTGRR